MCQLVNMLLYLYLLYMFMSYNVFVNVLKICLYLCLHCIFSCVHCCICFVSYDSYIPLYSMFLFLKYISPNFSGFNVAVAISKQFEDVVILNLSICKILLLIISKQLS